MTGAQHAATPSPDQYPGLTAVGPAKEPIGTIAQVYVDDRSGSPDWVTVDTDRSGDTQRFVPVEGSRIEGATLVLPFGADVVREAPRITDPSHLDPAQQEQLYAHYARHLTAGVDRSPPCPR